MILSGYTFGPYINQNQIIMLKIIALVVSVFAGFTAYMLSEKEVACNATPPVASTIDIDFNPNSVADEQPFYYGIDSRFMHQVTRERVLTAQTIEDLYPENTVSATQKFTEIKLSLMDPEIELSERDYGKLLSPAQKELLRTCNYASNLYLTSYYSSFDMNSASKIHNHIVYYMTVIPEVEAEYEGGRAAVIRYLREQMNEQTKDIPTSEIKPGRIKFTVDKKGIVRNVSVDSPSGFVEIDEAFLTHIAMMPGEWTPAKNANGENIDQELIFFYGSFGC